MIRRQAALQFRGQALPLVEWKIVRRTSLCEQERLSARAPSVLCNGHSADSFRRTRLAVPNRSLFLVRAGRKPAFLLARCVCSALGDFRDGLSACLSLLQLFGAGLLHACSNVAGYLQLFILCELHFVDCLWCCFARRFA